jgi:serine/threonine-protein kinase
MDGVSVKVGDLVADKYRVERMLGEGAMGVVVAARHVDIDRLVAIKFIKPQRGALEEQIARVFREAKAAGRLQSEHAGKVLDVGKLDGGVPYIVMELLAGKDLGAILHERGGLPVDEALLYVFQAAHAIAEAHTFGIVHRDIKPSNLFLTYGPADEPIVKVLDFGVSKLGPEEAGLTRTGEMLGSPMYMSPEQIKCSRDVDARSDVWSLSITLYELLAGPGITPFQGKSTYAVIASVTQDPPIPLTTYRPDLPPGLVAAITATFADKDPSRRYRSLAAFVSALAPYAPPAAAAYAKRIATIQFEDVQPARPTAEVRTGADAASASGSSARVVSATTGPVAAARSNRAPWVVAAVALAVAAALIVALQTRQSPSVTLPSLPSGGPAIQPTDPPKPDRPAVQVRTAAPPPEVTVEPSPAGSVAPVAASSAARTPAPPATHPKTAAKPVAQPGPTARSVDYGER